MPDSGTDANSKGKLSRREMLRRASAGLALTAAGAVLPPTAAAQSGGSATSQSALTPDTMPKAWSREEMQRRWRSVRQKMKESNFDCLLVPQHRMGAMIAERLEGDADVQWLAGIPAGWVVLPLEGKPIAITTGQIRPLWSEKKPVAGVILFVDSAGDMDVRFVGEGLWSKSITDSLRELGMSQAHIGIGDIEGTFRNEEGGVNYTTYERVRQAFPQARFDSAVDLLWRVKLVHSAEEIVALEKATQVSEAGLEAMFRTTRPGVVQRDVWLAMQDAMIRASGERPFRVAFRGGYDGNASLGFPLDEVFQSGQIMNQEISGSVLGYGSQVNHAVLIGAPAPADWKASAEYCLEMFHGLLDMAAPGKPVEELLAYYAQKVKARGGKPGGVLLHSGGLGDLPRWGPGRAEGAGIVLETGMVFDIKPSAPIKGARPEPQIGDSVVITEKGARRLGRRKMEVVTLGA